MGRTCDCSFNRPALLASEVAACFYCFEQFPPSAVTQWCDGDDAACQTAICPFCSVDSVVGFNGPVNVQWLHDRHTRSFG